MTDLELLREVADVPPGDEVERHARAMAHARLRAAVAAPPRRRRHRGWRLAPAVALAAAALVAIVAWPRGADVEREARPAVTPGPGEFFYMRSALERPGTAPTTRELWLGADGKGRLREGGEITELGGMTSPWTANGKRLSYDEWLALPTDVDALARYVDADAFGRTDHAEAQFMLVAELLSATPASRDLSRALFEVAKRIPGVETAPVADPEGRPGVRVSFEAESLRRDLIGDADGVLVADRFVDGDKVIASVVVEERGVVGAVGERP